MWLSNCYCLLFLGLSPCTVWRQLPLFLLDQLLGSSPLIFYFWESVRAGSTLKRLHKATVTYTFPWESFLVYLLVEKMALRQMSDLVRRASSSPKAPVTLQSLLIQRPKAATTSTHSWWLCTCSSTGWLQAPLLSLHTSTTATSSSSALTSVSVGP